MTIDLSKKQAGDYIFTTDYGRAKVIATIVKGKNIIDTGAYQYKLNGFRKDEHEHPTAFNSGRECAEYFIQANLKYEGITKTITRKDWEYYVYGKRTGINK